MVHATETERGNRIRQQLGAALPVFGVRPLHEGTAEVFVRDCFVDVLFRSPTPQELADGLRALSDGTTREEFCLRLATTEAAKEACLNRPLVAALERGTLEAENAPGSTSGALSELAEGAVGNGEELIQTAYQVILDRPATDDDINCWRRTQKRGLTSAVLLWAIVHSEENAARNGAAIPEQAEQLAAAVGRKTNLKQLLFLNGIAFIELAYRMFMGRSPDQCEKASYAEQLDAGWTAADFLWSMVRRGSFAAHVGRRRMLRESLRHPLTVGRWCLAHCLRLHVLRRLLAWPSQDAARYRVLAAAVAAHSASGVPAHNRCDHCGRDWEAFRAETAQRQQALGDKLEIISLSLDNLLEIEERWRRRCRKLLARTPQRQTTDALAARFNAMSHSLDALQRAYDRSDDRWNTISAQMAQQQAAMTRELGAKQLRGGLLVDDNVILAQHPFGWIFGLPAENWGLVRMFTFGTGFESGTLAVVASLCRKGATVVDVGAHVGLHSLVLADRVGKEGRVHCFEPCARSCRILRKNLFVSGFTNATVHQMALSDRCGQAAFFEFNDELSWSSLYPVSGAESCTQVNVEIARLDDVLPDARIDLVKIDAEGAEFDILQGMRGIIARNPQIQIVMEFGPSNIVRTGKRPEDLLQLIGDMGFSIQAIDEASGRLSSTTSQQLLAAYSVNLLLSSARAVSASEPLV